MIPSDESLVSGTPDHPTDEGASESAYVRLTSSKPLWLASFVALGTADFGSLANLTSMSSMALGGLGAAGGAGLIANGTTELGKSQTTEEKLDAANNIAWGGQGLMYLMPSSLGAMEVALGLGLLGSALQTGVGLLRVQRGVVRWDPSMIKLGLLDVTGGLLWLAWDMLGARQPLFVGAYMVTKAGREAYANRTSLRAFVGSIGTRLQTRYRSAASAAKRAWNDFEVGYEDGWQVQPPGSDGSAIRAMLLRTRI